MSEKRKKSRKMMEVLSTSFTRKTCCKITGSLIKIHRSAFLPSIFMSSAAKSEIARGLLVTIGEISIKRRYFWMKTTGYPRRLWGQCGCVDSCGAVFGYGDDLLPVPTLRACECVIGSPGSPRCVKRGDTMEAESATGSYTWFTFSCGHRAMREFPGKL